MSKPNLLLTVLQEKILSRDFSCIVICGDCRDIVNILPPESIDLTVMDPAYESLERHRAKGTTTRLTNSKASSNAWFQTFPNDDYHGLLAQLHAVHRPNTHCYIFCDSETEHVIYSGYNPYLKQGHDVATRTWNVWPPLTWVKTKKGRAPSDVEELEQAQIRAGMGYHWRRAEERILFLEKGKRKLRHLGWPNVLTGSRAGKNDYPTEKPLSVLHKLIRVVPCRPIGGLGVYASYVLIYGAFHTLDIYRRVLGLNLQKAPHHEDAQNNIQDSYEDGQTDPY